MIVFAGLAVHNPLLLQEAGAAETLAGLKKLADDLQQSAPDVVVIISPHAEQFEKVYSLYGHATLAASLKQFGRVAPAPLFTVAPRLNTAIRQAAKETGAPLQLVDNPEMDYGTAVSLELLGQKSTLPVILIGASGRSLTDHAQFGYFLKDVLHNANERVAIILSGDGAHAHDSSSPIGFSPDAKKFDDGLPAVLENRSVTGLTNLVKLNPQAAECVSRPLAIGFGILRHFPRAGKIHSYEVARGIGLLNATLFLI